MHDISSNAKSNTNSIFIALNLTLEADSGHTKKKTMFINPRHSRGQCHGEKLGKGEIRVDMFVQMSFFLNEWREVAELSSSGKSFQIIISKAEAKMLSRLIYKSGKVWDLKKH